MKRVLVILLSIVLLISTAPTNSQAAPVANRLAGSDRYKTAVAISNAGWQKSENVVLTTGENFPDALCAAPLAKQLKAPILLTGKNALNSDTEAEINRLGAQKIFLIGGEGVISNTVKNKLEAKGITVTRLWGNDRYETSYEVAKYIAENFSISSEMVVATGEDFPDALSVSSIAAQKNMLLQLVPKERMNGALSGKIQALIGEYGITKTYVIGGSSIISNTVAGLFPAPERIEGSDKYERNIAVLNKFNQDIQYDRVYLATGDAYPDALAGSALAPLTSSPIILTAKNPLRSTWSHVNSRVSSIQEIKVLGGSGAVPDTAINAILADTFGGGTVQPETPSTGNQSGVKVDSGSGHTLVVTADGSLWAFGYNYNGAVGKGSFEPYKNPLPIKIMTDVKDIAAGSSHSLAVKKDGSLWAWGMNRYGQVGNYTDVSTNDVPAPVKIMDDVTAVAAGYGHSLAVKNDGTLWAWGANGYGQLGDGTQDNNRQPKMIMDNVKAVAAGSDHSLALKNDGSVWAWGCNWAGQVDGTLENVLKPVKVMTDVKAIAAAAYFSMAIKNDGSLWIWGSNPYGGSSTNPYISHTKPVKVLTDVKEADGGADSHTVAVKTDGTLWVWGQDNAGQLFNIGNKSNGYFVGKPTKVMSDVAHATAGKYFTIIAKTDGTFWGVGYNVEGDLGNGTLQSTLTPTKVKIE